MQLDQARVVALLRRIGVPLAQIRAMLALDPASAAEQIRGYWAGPRWRTPPGGNWSATYPHFPYETWPRSGKLGSGMAAGRPLWS
jgi:DNA-binding transcriptional MerR regulator